MRGRPDDGWTARLRLLLLAYAKLALPLAIAILVIGGIRGGFILVDASRLPGAIGIDYTTVMDAARRWLDGSSPYLARQLAGPYQQVGATLADSGEMLYPPIAVPFFAVFSALPAVLWWAIAAVLGAIAAWRARPARWAWPILALCLVAGQSIPIIIAGNPTIWIVVAGLWAPLLGWPGPLVLLKPSVAPLALLGIRQRSWWIGAAALGGVSLLFGRLWVDWYRSVVDMRAAGDGGLLFSVSHLPLLLLPVIVAAAARKRGRMPRTVNGRRVGAEPPGPVSRSGAPPAR